MVRLTKPKSTLSTTKGSNICMDIMNSCYYLGWSLPAWGSSVSARLLGSPCMLAFIASGGWDGGGCGGGGGGGRVPIIFWVGWGDMGYS